jgi:hypothetical protein
MTRFLWSAFGASVLTISFFAAACGSSGGGSHFTGPGNGENDGGLVGDGTTGITPPSLTGEGGTHDFEGGQLTISPPSPTVNVTLGTTTTITPLQFSATYEGNTVSPQWTIDKGELGTLGVASGLFTPASLGGTATVTATYQGQTTTAPLTVKVSYVGIGDPNPPDAGAGGAGGFGGVGGSGEGAGATPGQVTSLNGTPTADPALTFLYPYDKTVFPRGVLPPLLQWTMGTHSFAAALIHISETNYDYKGYFQAPASPFQNSPIPQAVWNAVANSNGGENVSVQVTLLDGSGGVWGPVSESWVIAPGVLKGTIYYQSYGTKLAYNYSGAKGPNPNFGGATLAIKENATDPVLIAGNTTANPATDHTGCRVCHSVASGGSTLVTEHGDSYPTSSGYALTNGNTENSFANNNGNGLLAWPALSPKGDFLLSNSGGIAGGSGTASALYSTTDGSAIASTGLSGLGALTPAFSPDGTHVAYNWQSGTGADQASLGAIDFAATTTAFTNQRTLYTPASGHAYWPSFLPTNDGAVFELETVSNGRDLAGTRGTNDNGATTVDGTHGELWWVDLATKTGTRLDLANGKGYLPAHTTAVTTNGDDSTLNYEPTVNPVPSGGYAWVVFTSRRMYGNVATINPYWSDPRNNDISATPTTKKLWVAAIDLNAKAGTDPSHPAFYLPAQELLAGNARGFWVVDPCQADGASCVTGDECCGGYCRDGADGGLMCTATQPSCSQEYEKCVTSADCCGVNQGIQCIDGLCSQTGPK